MKLTPDSFLPAALVNIDWNPDIGNYRQKSNELPLQVVGIKSNFLVKIQLTENVIEFLSNYMSS